MTTKNFFINIGKLLLCSLVFIFGAIVGGTVLSFTRLQTPPMPEGADSYVAFMILMLESPILAFALLGIAKGIAGSYLLRGVILSIFTWVVYTLNTAIESLAFTSTTIEGALYTILSFLLPSILISVVAVRLFPSDDKGANLSTIVREFFSARKPIEWIWRITVAAVVFVPIYLFFGSLVAPMTAQYFQESAVGLRMPSQTEIFLVLSARSLLFLIACLPIIVTWQRSNWNLFLNLGFALFVLVGLLYMLGAYYMPLAIRIPHTLEILADSFAYAGLLVLLLAKKRIPSAIKHSDWGTKPRVA